MEKVKINIEGMGCNHCVAAVKKELSKLNFKVNEVNIGSAELESEGNKINTEDIEKAITDAGYKLISLEKI